MHAWVASACQMDKGGLREQSIKPYRRDPTITDDTVQMIVHSIIKSSHRFSDLEEWPHAKIQPIYNLYYDIHTDTEIFSITDFTLLA